MGSVFHGAISELMTSCAYRSFISATLGFVDGVGEAVATASYVFVLRDCTRKLWVPVESPVPIHAHRYKNFPYL
jgi:hypothetical protein